MYHPIGLFIEPRPLYYTIGRVFSLYKHKGSHHLILVIRNHITNAPSYVLSQQRDGRITRVASLMGITQRCHIGTSALIDGKHPGEILL